MKNIARKLDTAEAIQEIGTLTRIDSIDLVVRTDAGEYRAQRATSCLVAPQVGDVVLLSTTQAGPSYVTAILERAPSAIDAPTVLTAEGDMTVRLPKGRFAIAAQEGVELVSSKAVSIVANRFSLDAIEANVVAQKLDVLSTFVRAEVGRVKTFAGTIDTVLDRLTERVKRSYRTVEEFEQVRAERIDYEAKKTMNLRAENAIITADQLVKIDGEQIHLG